MITQASVFSHFTSFTVEVSHVGCHAACTLPRADAEERGGSEALPIAACDAPRRVSC